MSKKPRYYLDKNKGFVIENYNQAKPFSSFLPAIAGLYGKPMWVYYVNRGQCISSIGINNKDYSIMEFLPANKAYKQTQMQGFRTFLKVSIDNKVVFYEPFQDNLQNKDFDINQSLYITSHDFKLKDDNNTLGISVEVTFCTLPEESFCGLIKELVIKNISGKKVGIEILDGLPIILPYFLSNDDMKNVSNLRQAWMRVEHIDAIPFYKINVLPDDSPETAFVEAGNFYLNFVFEKDSVNCSKAIVEPSHVFGNITDFSYPEKFLENDFALPETQVKEGFTPCGFSHSEFELGDNETKTTYTLIGSVSKYEKIESFVNETLSEVYIKDKINANRVVIEKLKQNILTVSSSKEFDLYAGQTMLDNILRGGYPVQIGNGKHIYYVYSRKHGDLEREYNFFQVDSTYYSQGNSNFRDVNQNRRNDVSFFPYVQDENIKNFFNLIQLDGFNPLVLKGSKFTVADHCRLVEIVNKYANAAVRNFLTEYLQEPFTPGELLALIEEKDILIDKSEMDEFLNNLVEITEKEDIVDFKEGYWVDHWTYNNDLLERFNSIYPDKMLQVLFDDYDYTYYESNEVVVPRSKKYVLTDRGVRQYNAVEKSIEKDKQIKSRTENKNMVHIEYGKGKVYRTNLISKIAVLIVNKIASVDPNGVGIEMEANKPGWCDALNGMPGILGSSINISAEVKRLALIVKNIFEENNVSYNKTFKVPKEVSEFYCQIKTLLNQEISDFDYWNQSNSIKENYREITKLGISGKEETIKLNDFIEFLGLVIKKVDKGIKKAFCEEDGLHYTYFINEVTKYEISKDEDGNKLSNKDGLTLVEAIKFKQRSITYFLEGPVHVLRTEKNIGKARVMYKAIKNTGLYDEKLKMYKVNANIMEETKEIGRQNVFPRGWLENESVFLHMQYKYFFELLRSGLHNEFFYYLKNSMVPFLDPAVYRRSILENSSFIASSAHPDARIHGTGYVSRLTGASSEVLSMWTFMTAGEKPFFLNDSGELSLEFKPVIPHWLFTTEVNKTAKLNKSNEWIDINIDKNTFAFNFLGKTLVVYHNENRKSTYGEDAAQIYKIVLDMGETIELEGCVIPSPYAQQVRENKINKIDIYMK